MTYHLVFDKFPSPEGSRFIELEDSTGHSISAGEWRERKDGYVELVLPAPAGWQDIATAPRDGTSIIGYWEGYKRPCVMWWNFADKSFESWTERNEEPSHWLPLHASPNFTLKSDGRK